MIILLSLLVFGFFFAIPVLLVMILVKAIRKRPVKKTVLSMLGCLVGMIAAVFVLAQITCSHEWQDADCRNPRTCMLCGETQGEQGYHDWSNATCTTPKTCSVCGLTDGEALSADKSHTWIEATCAAPKTCTVCGAEEGTPIEHTLSDWEIIEEATTDAQGTRQQKCTVCEQVIKTEKFDSPFKAVVDIIEQAVSKYSGEADVEVIDGDEDNSVVVTAVLYCENSEQVVKNILASAADGLQKLDIKTQGLFTIGDIEDGPDGECLAMASIDADGNYKITPMSIDFKTERNVWIQDQFSAWDGSHTVLKDLIKDNLNDEKSFDHIETTFIDVSTDSKKDQVNNILKGAGYSQRVDVGDLFVVTKFSAKNAFNATIKSTAYGIVDESAGVVTLIAIE